MWFSQIKFLFFSIFLPLSICQFFLFISISSFFFSSSLSTSLFILHYLHPLSCIDLGSIDWALSAWPHFQPLIILHIMIYYAYCMLWCINGPASCFVNRQSHFIDPRGEIKERKIRKVFRQFFFCVESNRSRVSQCYFSVSKASRSAMGVKWPVLSISLLCL